MTLDADLLIIGAGPAGLAAAGTASEQGLSVLLLDEQPGPGGQIYRGITRAEVRDHRFLGSDYAAGEELAKIVERPSVRYRAGATVWRVEPEGLAAWSEAGQAHTARARRLLLATGALERPVPIPGWTLPGVMGAGAAQILLKSAGLVPRDAVLAGSGPLLYLLAVQLLDAGAPPRMLVETQAAGDLLGALPALPAALRRSEELIKGLGLLRRLRRAGIVRVTGASALAIEGEEIARGLRFKAGGRERQVESASIFLHQGVIPNIQFSRALRLEHRWHAAQHCWHPVRDGWGESSAPGVFLAGDGGGIAGARAAALQGRLAALEIACQLGHSDAETRDRDARPLRQALARELALRPFLDRLYAPPPAIRRPADDTVVCRCEMVRAGEIRAQARLGCLGLNQLKVFSRSGMGPCQGRYCGPTVAAILADARGVAPDAVGYYRLRMPVKPVTLAELASLAPDELPEPHRP